MIYSACNVCRNIVDPQWRRTAKRFLGSVEGNPGMSQRIDFGLFVSLNGNFYGLFGLKRPSP
jgi:hypothetical protein